MNDSQAAANTSNEANNFVDFSAPVEVCSLSYIVIESPDPGKWREFGTEVMGLMEVRPEGCQEDSVYLKMDARPYRFAIHKGAQERYLLCGWEVADADELQAICESLDQQQTPYTQGTPEECAERRVHELIRLQDPSGNTLELCHGCGLDYSRFVSPLGVSGFVTGEDGELGLGHVVLCAENLAATRDFYREILGFDDSDYMDVPNPDGSSCGLHFMHCGSPRHHSLGLYGVPAAIFPAGCVHTMVEVTDMDEVGACLDRVNSRGIHIFSTLGRHSNDRMLSFYMMSPSGFAMEYGCHGRLLDWHSFKPTITTGRGSLWGHQFQLPTAPSE